MTVLRDPEQFHSSAAASLRPVSSEKPDAYLMLMLRRLSDDELVELEQCMQVYVRTSEVSRPLMQFID